MREACAPKAGIWGDFNSPSGEFGEYLKSKGLVPRKPGLGIKTCILHKKALEDPA